MQEIRAGNETTVPTFEKQCVGAVGWKTKKGKITGRCVSGWTE